MREIFAALNDVIEMLEEDPEFAVEASTLNDVFTKLALASQT